MLIVNLAISGADQPGSKHRGDPMGPDHFLWEHATSSNPQVIIVFVFFFIFVPAVVFFTRQFLALKWELVGWSFSLFPSFFLIILAKINRHLLYRQHHFSGLCLLGSAPFSAPCLLALSTSTSLLYPSQTLRRWDKSPFNAFSIFPYYTPAELSGSFDSSFFGQT